jgi:hypothetical protein
MKPAALVILVALLVPATAAAARRSDGSTPAPAAVLSAVAGVPATTLDQVGLGSVDAQSEFTLKRLAPSSGPKAAKVGVVALDAAWCPHCAANSWPLAIALGRFGVLSGLRVIDSGAYYAKHLHAKPGYSHTRGLSFIDARYASPLITFTSIVIADNKGRALQRPSKAEQRTFHRFDPENGVPAVDLAGAFGAVGVGYSPGLLSGLSAEAIAAGIGDPTSALAKHIDGEANVLTAAICVATAEQPQEVCSSPGVSAAASRLPNKR